MEKREPNLHRGTPESHLQAVQAMNLRPFDIVVNSIPEEVVKKFQQDPQLRIKLIAESWPTDEATCEKIAKQLNMGAEQVAAVSKYERAIAAKIKEGQAH